MDIEMKKKVQELFNLDLDAITEDMVKAYAGYAEQHEDFCKTFVKVSNNEGFRRAAELLFAFPLASGVFNMGVHLNTMQYVYASRAFLTRIPYLIEHDTPGLYLVRYRFRTDIPGTSIPEWRYLITACADPQSLFLFDEVTVEFEALSDKARAKFEGLETEIFRLSKIDDITEILESLCNEELYNKDSLECDMEKVFGQLFKPEANKGVVKTFTSSRDLTN